MRLSEFGRHRTRCRALYGSGAAEVAVDARRRSGLMRSLALHDDNAHLLRCDLALDVHIFMGAAPRTSFWLRPRLLRQLGRPMKPLLVCRIISSLHKCECHSERSEESACERSAEHKAGSSGRLKT